MSIDRLKERFDEILKDIPGEDVVKAFKSMGYHFEKLPKQPSPVLVKRNRYDAVSTMATHSIPMRMFWENNRNRKETDGYNMDGALGRAINKARR